MSRRKIIPYQPHLKELARELRNNSTKAEVILWGYLKGKQCLGYDFHRQKPIDRFIVDFFCHELMLAIEIDGFTHNEKVIREKDFKKEKRLNDLGISVLRFPDSDVYFHLRDVLTEIEQYVKEFDRKSTN